MILSDIIGQEISKIRYSYQPENEHGMQEFHSYLRFATKEVIFLPKYPDNEMDLIEYYDKNKTCSFGKAERCGMASRVLFKNKKIVDVHFRYFEGTPLEDSSGILELDNGMYITENNFGPPGLTNIDLMILNSEQFAALGDDEIEIRSFNSMRS